MKAPAGGYISAPALEPVAPVRVSDGQRTTVHMAASLLLDYPGERLYASLPVLTGSVSGSSRDGLPAPIRDRLIAMIDHLEAIGPQQAQRNYVDTFDLKRKCSMYLSYFLTGDTRKRGTALVRFIEAYRAVGFEVDRSELPDFLPLVLEFSARAGAVDGGPEIAAGLLNAHRQGIEVLRSSLTSMRSPYAAVVEAVCQTLPPVSDRVRDRYLELITAGPPTEMVGLSALGPLEPYRATEQEVRI